MRRHTRGAVGNGRRLLFVLMVAAVAGQPVQGTTDQAPGSDVSVREDQGVYQVRARFRVAALPSTALAVLTDYERIPRFIRQVKTSIIRERTGSRVVVEQEATASVMMFSKRIHLLLVVQEGAHRLSFKDASGRSFTQYEGTWCAREENGSIIVSYELNAKPSFTVPGFLLKRLLKRDAQEMIERLREEIAGIVEDARHHTP